MNLFSFILTSGGHPGAESNKLIRIREFYLLGYSAIFLKIELFITTAMENINSYYQESSPSDRRILLQTKIWYSKLSKLSETLI
jgi:hypothetical protein